MAKVKKVKYDKLISEITIEEGGKVEVSRGNVKSVVKIIAKRFVENPLGMTMLLMRIGSR